MKKSLSRRDFAKLTGAAFGGVVAGSMLGCSKPDDAAPVAGNDGDGGDAPTTDGDAPAAETHDPKLLIEGKNVCRGLNHTCANHKEGDNKCAGQGSCATATAHSCHGENECKGQGGCGDYPGQNQCKAKGDCGVPLGDKAWTTARAAFEKAMTEAEKKFGPAPAAS